jgi:hypothetical protein
MQRLREVIGDNANINTNMPQQPSSVRLDEMSISREDLDRKIQNQGNSERIVEVDENNYKTLKRMYS